MTPQAPRTGGSGSTGGRSGGSNRGSGQGRSGGSSGGSGSGRSGGSSGGYRGSGGGEGYRGSSGGGDGYRSSGDTYRGGTSGGGSRGSAGGGASRGAAGTGGSTRGSAASGASSRSASGGSSRSSSATGGSSRGGAPSSPRSGAPRAKSGYPRSAAPAGASRSRTPARPPRQRVPEVTIDVHDPDGVRLQKVLAAAGLGSRRACEDLISAGRVTVDNNLVRELGVRVDPLTAVIHVDGLRVQLDTSMVTIALNKPKGVVSTMHDPEGRESIGQYVQDRVERLFHVGRLDAETEGLILLTNDGELANRLAHPAHAVPKVYLVQLEGRVTNSLGGRLLKGIELEDGPAKLDKFQIVQTTPQASLVEVELHEGRNRIVRRMFEESGYPVTGLVRTQIGPIRLGDLKTGRTRVLSKTEVGSLMARVGM